jgi:hypothetical protein
MSCPCEQRPKMCGDRTFAVTVLPKTHTLSAPLRQPPRRRFHFPYCVVDPNPSAIRKIAGLYFESDQFTTPPSEQPEWRALALGLTTRARARSPNVRSRLDLSTCLNDAVCLMW